MGMAFDTFAMSKRLKEKGFTQEQSEALVELFSETAKAFPTLCRVDMVTTLDLAVIRSEFALSEMRTTVWIGKLLGMAVILIILVILLLE